MPATARTVTGVRTAVAAFVGFTKQGPVNRAVEVFNFGDYERAFGTLDRDSEVSFAVQHYFQNGGADAIVVRCAGGAEASSVQLMNRRRLDRARAEGRIGREWGNNLRAIADYDTSNPNSTFNLTIQDVAVRNGQQEVVRSEQHRNLSMNSRAPNYAVDVIASNSQMVRASRGAAALGLLLAGTVGTSRTGAIAAVTSRRSTRSGRGSTSC